MTTSSTSKSYPQVAYEMVAANEGATAAQLYDSNAVKGIQIARIAAALLHLTKKGYLRREPVKTASNRLTYHYWLTDRSPDFRRPQPGRKATIRASVVRAWKLPKVDAKKEAEPRAALQADLRVVVRFGEKELSLTPQDARSLYAALSSIFTEVNHEPTDATT